MMRTHLLIDPQPCNALLSSNKGGNPRRLRNIYMRRFIMGWKVLGYTQRFKAHIVNYADNLVVLGKTPSADMLTALESLMQRLS